MYSLKLILVTVFSAILGYYITKVLRTQVTLTDILFIVSDVVIIIVLLKSLKRESI